MTKHIQMMKTPRSFLAAPLSLVPIFATLAFVFTACARVDTSNRSAPTAHGGGELDATELESFEFTLIDAYTARGERIDALFVSGQPPIALRFKEGRVQIKNACNLLSAPYGVGDDTISFGMMMGTKRACIDDAVSRLDLEMSERLNGRVRFELEGSREGASLQLIEESGDALVFRGSLTAEARYGGPGETVFLEIAAEPTRCADGSEPCLLARELEYRDGLRAEEGEWFTLEEPIEGFEFQQGIQSVLRCTRFESDSGHQTLRLELIVESRSGE